MDRGAKSRRPLIQRGAVRRDQEHFITHNRYCENPLCKVSRLAFHVIELSAVQLTKSAGKLWSIRGS